MSKRASGWIPEADDLAITQARECLERIWHGTYAERRVARSECSGHLSRVLAVLERLREGQDE